MGKYKTGSWVVLNPEFELLTNIAEVLDNDGGGVLLKTDGSNRMLVADYEVSVAHTFPSGAIERRRTSLPYGKWTCEDGREVLFNRDYKPIWQRTSDGTVSKADSDEHVKFAKQEWFYNDTCVPWTDRDMSNMLVDRLAQWGLPKPAFPG